MQYDVGKVFTVADILLYVLSEDCLSDVFIRCAGSATALSRMSSVCRGVGAGQRPRTDPNWEQHTQRPPGIR